jgi:hypothetical protein
MSEQYPDSELFDTYTIGDRSLRQWHYWLTHDADGTITGHLPSPSNRYGTTRYQCAWMAVAARIALTDAINPPDDLEASMHDLMSQAVNGEPALRELLLTHGESIPEDVWYLLDPITFTQGWPGQPARDGLDLDALILEDDELSEDAMSVFWRKDLGEDT